MSSTHLNPAAARTVHDLPTPRGWPLLGQLLQLDPLHAPQQMERWARELGTPYRLNLAGMPVVVWDDTAVFQQIARERPGRWRRGGRILPVAREMGFDGLFAIEGDAWAPQRRLVMQALSPVHLRGYFPTLQAITARLHARWCAAADEGRVVEMTDDLMRYTVDVTCALSFGEDPDTLSRDDDRIQRHLAGIFPMFMKRIMTPWSTWHWFKRPADRRLDRDLAAVHAYIDGLIARTRAQWTDGPPAQPRHLLDAMLVAAQASGSGIDDATVRANVLTLLLAGEDTTANSLAWTMLHLSAHPAWQDRLHMEALAALGGQPVCPDLDTLTRLDAQEAAVTEAQRLSPVAPLQSFEPAEDTVVAGLAIPRGTKVFFLNGPALRDARHFHEPDRYDPARWLRAREQQPGPHESRAFMQFGAGPRVCPGRHLAGVEMRLVMSMLMRGFRIELATDPSTIDAVSALTCGPDRMPVRLHRRPAPRP